MIFIHVQFINHVKSYVIHNWFQANQWTHLDKYRQARDLQLGSLRWVHKDYHMRKGWYTTYFDMQHDQGIPGCWHNQQPK